MAADARQEPQPSHVTPPVPVEEALSAVLNGAVWRGFDGADGVSKDEALEYAGVLANRVKAVLAFIADMGCLCDDGCHHASLPDHELHCPARIEHLLRTDPTDGLRFETVAASLHMTRPIRPSTLRDAVGHLAGNHIPEDSAPSTGLVPVVNRQYISGGV